MPKKRDLTQKRLMELILYFPHSGNFFWRNIPRSGGRHSGSIAGSISKFGYRKICIDGNVYHASNLAWLYVHGEIPAEDIDHINRKRSDDRIVNLRIATRNQNLRNSAARSSSGFKGVYENRGRWIVQFRVNKKIHHVGMFGTKEEANVASIEARLKIDPVFYDKA